MAEAAAAARISSDVFKACYTIGSVCVVPSRKSCCQLVAWHGTADVTTNISKQEQEQDTILC